MKKYYITICVLMLLCVIGSTVILILSPDIIPVHYNFKGEIDRYGSKYENLLFPGVTLLLGIFLMFSAKKQRGKGEDTNEKTMLMAAVFTIMFFDAMSFYWGIKAILLSDGGSASGMTNIGKFVGIAIGLLLCLLGNIMPKVRKNSVFGLRTKWSLANDHVWQKSQRFAGLSSVICGLVIIVASAVLTDMWTLLVLVIVPAVWIVFNITASYRYYRNELKEENKNTVGND